MKPIAATAMLALTAAFVSTMAQGQDAETYPPTVPLMLRAGSEYGQSFVRLINKSDYAGEVEITAVDDGGTADSVTVQLAAGQTIHFNSGDLTDGNASKGIEGIGSPRQGNWRLTVDTLLDVQVLSFIRTRDGFLTAMHDVVPWQQVDLFAGIFNPASNTTQESRLRLINWGAEDAKVEIEGKDDDDAVRGPVSLTLRAGQSRTLTAVDLEEGAHDLTGSLGDGMGKWQLTLRGELRSMVAQSLLYASSGHISNISRDGFSATERHGGADHADSTTNATPLALNGHRSGRINRNGDQDYFKVEIQSSGILILYADGPLDTEIVLYDSAGQTLYSNRYGNDDGVNNNFRLQLDLEAGTYFVRVYEHDDDDTGPYTVYTDFFDHKDDDHGRTLSDATNLRVDGRQSGRIQWLGDQDYFRVAINRAGTMTFYADGPLDTEIVLYDSAGQTLYSNRYGNDDGVNNNFRLQLDLEAGTYFVRVYEYGNNDTGPYTVYAEFTPN